MSSFFASIGILTWIVLIVLSLYFIVNIWIFFWRMLKLSEIASIERESLDMISDGVEPLNKSIFHHLIIAKKLDKNSLEVCNMKAVNNLTIGLSFLSLISSTAPFIGLFGTVVEILEAFYQLGGDSKVSFEIIAPIISKALIATAFGILTAIPAYSFYIILKRKAYIVSTYLDMQISILLSQKSNITTRITLR